MTNNFGGRTFTITYCDQAENHKGMQIIGQMADRGYNLGELELARNNFANLGANVEIINLNEYLPEGVQGVEGAYVLVIRNGAELLLNREGKSAREMFDEQMNLEYDKKAFMYGRVVNKHARHNLCFSEEAQEPSYEEGKGRIIPFSMIPCTNIIRNGISELVPNSNNLSAEANYYYDITKCGIGMHGDAERFKVIAVRLGESLDMHYHWYLKNIPVGRRCQFTLNHGDMYIMSAKAVGKNWKSSSKYTLRHATGCDKFTNV